MAKQNIYLVGIIEEVVLKKKFSNYQTYIMIGYIKMIKKIFLIRLNKPQ